MENALISGLLRLERIEEGAERLPRYRQMVAEESRRAGWHTLPELTTSRPALPRRPAPAPAPAPPHPPAPPPPSRPCVSLAAGAAAGGRGGRGGR
jgi:hypothetical protein